MADELRFDIIINSKDVDRTNRQIATLASGMRDTGAAANFALSQVEALGRSKAFKVDIVGDLKSAKPAEIEQISADKKKAALDVEARLRESMNARDLAAQTQIAQGKAKVLADEVGRLALRERAESTALNKALQAARVKEQAAKLEAKASGTDTSKAAAAQATADRLRLQTLHEQAKVSSTAISAQARVAREQLQQVTQLKVATQEQARSSITELTNAQRVLATRTAIAEKVREALAAQGGATGAASAGTTGRTPKERSDELEWAKTTEMKNLLDVEMRARQAATGATDAQTQAELRAHAAALEEIRLNRVLEDALNKTNRARRAAAGGGGAKPPSGGGLPGLDQDPTWDPKEDAAAWAASQAVLQNGVGKTSQVVKKGKVDMREFSIEMRSMLSVMSGTSLQGALYYFSQIGRNLEGMALKGALVGFGIAVVIAGIAALVRKGAEVEGVSKAFDNLTASAGMAGNELAKSIKTAAHGTVTLEQAMVQSNRAFLAGGESFAKELPRLMDIARTRALATGKDINYVFESIAKGVARGSPRLIDNADIYIKLGDAAGDYAREHGKVVTQLTAEDKILSTLEATLRAGEEGSRKLGLSGQMAADDIKGFSASIKDLVASLGELAVATNVTRVLGRTGQRISDLSEATAAGHDWEKQIESMKRLGLVEAAREAYFKRNAELAAMQRRGESAAEVAKFYAELTAETQKLIDEENKRREPKDRGDVGNAERHRLDLIVEETDAVKALHAAFSDAAEMDSQQERLYKGLGEKAKAMTELIGTIQVPELGKNVMATDVAAWEDWLEVIGRTVGVQSKEYDQLSKLIAQMRDEQSGLMMRATLYATVEERVKSFAVSMFGLGSTAATVIENFDEMTPQMQGFAVTLGTLQEAIKELYTTRDEPINIKVQADSVKKAQEAVDEMALSIAKAGGFDAAEEFRARGTEAIKSYGAGFVQGGPALNAQALAVIEQNVIQQLDNEAKRIADRYTELQTLSSNLSKLSLEMPEMPKLGDTFLLTDTDALNKQLDAIQRLGEVTPTAIAETRSHITALSDQQQAAIATALALQSPAAALAYLTQKLGGAGAGIEDFMAKAKQIPAALLSAISTTRLFTAVIGELIAKTREPITIEMAMETVDSGIKSIQSAAASLVEFMKPGEVLNVSRNAIDLYGADMAALGLRENARNKDNWDIQAAYILAHYTKAIGDANSYYSSLESRSKSSAAALKKDAGEIKSAIEAALSKGLEVTQTDMLATKAGTYMEKPMEAARRLNAIAERGFSELRRHADWAAVLKIPPDILAGSEAGLKAWAANTSQAVQDMARPDLIDWDAFIENYKQGIKDAEARKLTVDIALGKLKTAGLLEGKTDAEARKAILKELGLAEPEVTFATMFPEATTDDPVLSMFFKSLRDDKPGELEANVAITLSAEDAATLKRIEDISQVALPKSLELPSVAPKTMTPGGPVPTIEKDTSSPIVDYADRLAGSVDVTQAGKDIAGKLYSSFDAAVKAQTPGVVVANYWGADFQTATPMWTAVGTSAGETTATAFVVAMEKSVGKVRRRMAELIAPEVAEILNMKSNNGAKP